MSLRTDNLFYQVTVPSEKRPLSGVVATALIAGLFVNYENDSTPEDSRKLIPATGRKGALLQRKVVSEADWKAGLLADVTFQNKLKTDLPVGSAVSAEYAQESEHEGALHLDGIDEETPVDSPLTTNAGKLKLWEDAGDGEIVGYLRRHITPLVSSNATRIVVEWA